MIIDKLETHGRKLLVEFTCYRCKAVAIRPLQTCLEESKECYRGLYDLNPPREWENGGFYYPLFCPDCAADYKKFMGGWGLEK